MDGNCNEEKLHPLAEYLQKCLEDVYVSQESFALETGIAKGTASRLINLKRGGKINRQTVSALLKFASRGEGQPDSCNPTDKMSNLRKKITEAGIRQALDDAKREPKKDWLIKRQLSQYGIRDSPSGLRFDFWEVSAPMETGSPEFVGQTPPKRWAKCYYLAKRTDRDKAHIKAALKRHRAVLEAIDSEPLANMHLAPPILSEFSDMGNIHIVQMRPQGERLDKLLEDASNLRQQAEISDRDLPNRHYIRISEGIATGLAILHKKGFILRDLRPEAVWVDENGIAAINDLEGATVENARNTVSVKDQWPASPYISLEVRLGRVSGTKKERLPPCADRADVFSWASITQEIFKISQAPTCPDWLSNLTNKGVNRDKPNERPSIAEILDAFKGNQT